MLRSVGLVCTGERSGMNLMATVGVFLVVPSVTGLSSGSDEPWSLLGERLGQH